MCIALAGVAHAAAKRAVAVEITPARDWRAEALTAALTADLADDRLSARALPACDGSCDDDALRAAGIELIVRAQLVGAEPAQFRYELRALWPGAPGPQRGVIPLVARERVELAGVLRDRLHRMARATEHEVATTAARAQPLPSPLEVAELVVIALAVLAVPLLFGFVRARRLLARAAARRTLVGVAVLGGVAMVIAVIDPSHSDGVRLAAGGVAWGTFAGVTVPVVFPPLVGIGQIDASDLGRVVWRWTGLVVRRAFVVAVIYAPVGAAIAAAPAELIGGEHARFALILPLALLVARQWVRLAIAVAAERLDAQLIDTTTDVDGWHAAARGYLIGYLRRNGLPIDEELLDRVRIVPARSGLGSLGDDVSVYGGGATHTRIAVPRKLLELALAPWGRPHDYAAPRVSTLHWTQWNAGLVMANEPGTAIATREQRQPRETKDEGDPSEHAHERLGEPPTLAGIVEPAALDPRYRHRPHDDPAWLDWELDEEYDGTDAGDRDFLFGALVHALAQAQRHGDRQSTLALVLRRASRITAPVAVPLGRLLDRLPDALADDHAAISGARHHLVQYLGWLAFQREDLLTARAHAPELAAMSRKVLAERAAGPSSSARARVRLGRLAVAVSGASAASTRRKRLAIAVALLAGACVAGLAVVDAVRYRAIWAERQLRESSLKVDAKGTAK